MKRLLSFVFLTTIYLLLTTNIHAKTITVCTTTGCDYSSAGGIQEAIDKAVNGDIVLIKSGNYPILQPIVADPNYKYEDCLIHTRGKKITLKAEGNVVIDNQYGGNGGEGSKMSTGICVIGGEVNIESISVKQTLRFALYIENAKAVVKNFKTIDIDNTSIVARQSQLMIFNSFLTGGGIDASSNTYALIENNTIYGGEILLDLCNVNLTGSISNNILTRSSLTVKCPEKVQNNADLKITNNFVYKGSPRGDQSCISSGNTEGETCGAGEYCDGLIFQWPGFVGADENGTLCVWGEGWVQGDPNTRADSPATKAGAGISTGPCVNGASTTCTAYIQAHPLPETPQTEEPPIVNPPVNPQPGNPVPDNGSNYHFGMNIVPTQFLTKINMVTFPKIGFFSKTENKNDIFMNIFLFVIFSIAFIMVIHFAFAIENFNLLLTLAYFILGGVIGLWFNSWMMGLAISMVLTLLFI